MQNISDELSLRPEIIRSGVITKYSLDTPSSARDEVQCVRRCTNTKSPFSETAIAEIVSQLQKERDSGIIAVDFDEKTTMQIFGRNVFSEQRVFPRVYFGQVVRWRDLPEGDFLANMNADRAHRHGVRSRIDTIHKKICDTRTAFLVLVGQQKNTLGQYGNVYMHIHEDDKVVDRETGVYTFANGKPNQFAGLNHLRF